MPSSYSTIKPSLLMYAQCEIKSTFNKQRALLRYITRGHIERFPCTNLGVGLALIVNSLSMLLNECVFFTRWKDFDETAFIRIWSLYRETILRVACGEYQNLKYELKLRNLRWRNKILFIFIVITSVGTEWQKVKWSKMNGICDRSFWPWFARAEKLLLQMFKGIIFYRNRNCCIKLLCAQEFHLKLLCDPFHQSLCTSSF